MPGPSRNRRGQHKTIDEDVVIPYVRDAGARIGSYYSTYSDILCPLSNFKTLPNDIFAVVQPNSDVVLRCSDGQEATFDVIGMIVSSCLEPPPGFSKLSAYPHFRRWVKVSGVDEPFFAAALDGCEVLYNFMALRASDVLPPPQFLAGGSQCFRPSAEMLTSLETVPDAAAVEVPPLYDHQPLQAALRAGHGQYVFSSDNEVLFFGDELMGNGEVVRHEINTSAVRVGQIAQIKMCFRLLKQANGTFTFRQLLKGVYILHDGMSMEIARSVADGSLTTQRKGNRNVKFYTVARNITQAAPRLGHTNADASGN